MIRANPYHEPAGSSKGGQFAKGQGGGKAPGGEKLKSEKTKEVLSKGTVPQGGSDLKWKSEDTITGTLVIEFPEDFDISQVDEVSIQEFIKKNLPGKIGSIDSSDDIEAVKVVGLDTGKGWVSAKLDITPSEKAGEHWLDTGDAAGQWSTYHGGRMMNTISQLLESIKRLFDPLIETERLDKNENKTYSSWEACIKDQMKPKSEGGGGYDEETAKEVCGKIKAKGGCRAIQLEQIFPTQTRSFTITRDAAGKPRWLMIAASAVVNKVGAIDSTTLFDNFIRHAPESGYPVLDFLHERERIRFGVADWLRRDGALYLASGTFDDTDLGHAAATGLEMQADYWGASIAYRIMETPLMLHAEGNIPVYTNGINDFISIVPKRMAANLFTTAGVAEEVKRMNQASFDELVKLVGAERAAQFAGDVDDANRTITETGMVTRADTTPVEAAPEVAPVTPTETPQIEPPVETRQEPPAADTSLDEIRASIAALTERIAKIEQGAGTAQEESARAITHETELLTKLDERLAGVESIKQRWLDWLNDLPENIKQEADTIYRARNQEPALMTMAQIAEQNVSKLNRGPHQRHP